MSQEDRPIAYFSEKLSDAKRKYSIYDKEFYAIVQTLSSLYGVCFIYLSSSFIIFQQSRKIESKTSNWVDFLQSYTFILKHRSGNSNRIVDTFNKRKILLTKMQIEVGGFKELTNLYLDDPNFVKHGRLVQNLLHLRGQSG